MGTGAVGSSDHLDAIRVAVPADEEVLEVRDLARPSEATADLVLERMVVRGAEVHGVRVALTDVVVGAGIAERLTALARRDWRTVADDADDLIGDLASAAPGVCAAKLTLTALDVALSLFTELLPLATVALSARRLLLSVALDPGFVAALAERQPCLPEAQRALEFGTGHN